MEAPAITPLLEDGDAAFGKDAQQFLTVIADMQREAEQRRLLLDELRQKEAAAKAELEKCLAAREALVARMAHTKAEGLELQVEHNELGSRQRAAAAAALELRRQKAQWAQLQRLHQAPSAPPSSPIRGRSDDGDEAHVPGMPQLARALHAWSQLSHGSLFLQELKTMLTEFMTELQLNTGRTSDEVARTLHNEASTDHTTAVLDLAIIFPQLPSLSPVEKAVLSLVPFSD
ncbi:uncharacterized protein Tco025E_04157 [Trypanosoma conorhini]|uniref:Uncharacterized protein n=1 Tax=Trypanosoma conorhini TaxID=83891 RepID=A0A3R7MR98_9TRYP|nr:uncharacterized protein Tco025E_04157 [Trypanosoma conorhini]RNF19370.1 hypothetical protein Tco025E_04157 [Trypanosoma conorhini]